MNRPPLTPAVLVLIDKDSRLSILQDEGVQVAFADERVDRHAVTLLPRKDQAQELHARLEGKVVVSPTNDHGRTAQNAIRQLENSHVITTGRKAE